MPKKVEKKVNSGLYDENSIITQTPREFTRRVPSTYLGSSRTNTNLVKEVFANAVDEHAIGHGNFIRVVIDTEKNIYIVEDNGQGFLVNAGIDEDGETILQRSFDKINTSGKTSEDGVYQGTALGLNGIGAKLTNWLSEELHVITYRDGESEAIWFKDGLFVKREVKKNVKHESGTIVTWHPDPQFFSENAPDNALLMNHFEIISALCPELTIEYSYNGNVTTFAEPGGLNTYVDRKVKGKELFSNRFITDRAIGKDRLNICITYTSDYSDHIDAYVNLGLTDSGAHITAFKTAFSRAVNKYAVEAGLLKKTAKSLSINEISEGMHVLCNMTTTTAKYDAQNKSRIDDVDATIINNVIGGDFATWLMNNPGDAKIIIEKALTARQAREAAQKAKDKIRDAGKVNKKTLFADLPSKLVDCYPKKKNDRSNCELLICEGDSASGLLIAMRDATTTAIMPIRGKIISALKATPDKVYGNQEVSSIVKALGLEIDKGTGKLIYDASKLRYQKIIIASDADADGDQIANLIITLMYWLCPELIINGHIYRVHGALFNVVFDNNTHKLFYTNGEFNEWRSKNTKKYTVSRAKGLGEMTKEETYEQLLDPATRNLHRLVTEDFADFEHWLEVFQGNDAAPRQDFLEKIDSGEIVLNTDI